MRLLALTVVLLAGSGALVRAQGLPVEPASVPALVVGDALPTPLSATPGDAARGRTIVASRSVGLCLLCHSGPFPEERFQGTLAPSLAGAGARWSPAQLRLRLVDGARLNPDTIMPSYYRTSGCNAWPGPSRTRPS